MAVPSPSAQRAALPPASSLLVTHGRGGLALGNGGYFVLEGGAGQSGRSYCRALGWECSRGARKFVVYIPVQVLHCCTTAAKSSVGVDQISILESLNFMQKGWRSLLREGGTCCCGMSPLLLHRWLIAPHDFLTHKISPPKVSFFLD